MARPGHTVYKMFRAVEDEQREKTQYIEIGTAFLRADGKSIGLEFNGPPDDFVAFRQDPKDKAGDTAA